MAESEQRGALRDETGTDRYDLGYDDGARAQDHWTRVAETERDAARAENARLRKFAEWCADLSPHCRQSEIRAAALAALHARPDGGTDG